MLAAGPQRALAVMVFHDVFEGVHGQAALRNPLESVRREVKLGNSSPHAEAEDSQPRINLSSQLRLVALFAAPPIHGLPRARDSSRPDAFSGAQGGYATIRIRRWGVQPVKSKQRGGRIQANG